MEDPNQMSSLARNAVAVRTFSITNWIVPGSHVAGPWKIYHVAMITLQASQQSKSLSAEHVSKNGRYGVEGHEFQQRPIVRAEYLTKSTAESLLPRLSFSAAEFSNIVQRNLSKNI